VTFTSWRGTIGLISPRKTSESFYDLARIMPDGIGMIPATVNIDGRDADDYRAAIPAYERRIGELATEDLNLIHPEGAPPFMLYGPKGERQLFDKWSKKFKMPVFSTGITQLAAMKALGIKTFFGVTSHKGKMAEVFSKYFVDAGFKVTAMERPLPLSMAIADLSAEEIYSRTKEAFLAHRGGAQAIFAQGAAWRVIDVIEELEQDLGVPVLSPTAVRCWYIQKMLNVRQPIKGYGHLLAAMP
jgi:maleate isomerase